MMRMLGNQFSILLVGVQIDNTFLESNFTIWIKNISIHTFNIVIPLTGIYPKEITMDVEKYRNVYDNFVHNSRTGNNLSVWK